MATIYREGEGVIEKVNYVVVFENREQPIREVKFKIRLSSISFKNRFYHFINYICRCFAFRATKMKGKWFVLIYSKGEC